MACLSEVVDPSKLQQCGHAIAKAADNVPVQSCGIMHL